jgi:hypothetical protein
VGNAIDRRCVLIVVVPNPDNSCATDRMQVRGLAKTHIRAEDIAVTHPRRIPMTIRSAAFCVGAVVFAAAMVLTLGLPAEALTAKECSAKYQAAKAAGTLNGKKWNDFRKTECGPDAAAAPATPPPTAEPAKPAPGPRAAPASAGNAVFPTAVSPKYSHESPGKARRHTCLDQYNANKATNANGGLKWIQKGGGYYSECNKHLKG